MAFGQSDPSKTEKATPKRRNKARKEGNVPKAQEIPKTISIFAGLIGMQFWVGVLAEHLQEIFRHFLSHSVDFIVTKESVYALLIWLGKELAMMLLPILFLLAFSAFLIMRLQVGKLWAPKFKLKMSQFNVFTGMKKLFISAETFIRLFKSLLQALAIGVAPYLVIQSELHNLLPLYYADAMGVSVFMLETAYKMVLYALIPMTIISLADLWYTRWNYEEQLKMTKDEVKDEMKQTQGDPMIKQRQKQKMMEVMSKRMMEDVPKADVVITNPTHIAVAIRYNAMEAPAPVVVAMGADHIAEKIKEIARENGVPLRENVPLARALYKAVEVGDMIPEELYKAVAAVLATLSRFKTKPGS